MYIQSRQHLLHVHRRLVAGRIECVDVSVVPVAAGADYLAVDLKAPRSSSLSDAVGAVRTEQMELRWGLGRRRTSSSDAGVHIHAGD